MTVYVDLIFLFNFVIDGILLLTTAWTRRLEIKRVRLVASAAVGASYTVFMLFPGLSALYTFAAKLAFSALMLLIAFRYRGWVPFLKTMGAFYLINFAAGGGILGLHYFLLPSLEIWDGIGFTRSGGLHFSVQIHLAVIIVGLISALFFYVRLSRSQQRQNELTEYLADIRIVIEDFTISCKGLIDTGNRLYDPLTKTPVMVTQISIWGDRFPLQWLKKIQRAEAEQIVTTMEHDDFIWADRLRLIPYRGVNNGTRFMLALKPDQVTVAHQGREINSHRVLIGLDTGQLSPEGSYEAIIHPELIRVREEAV